MRYSNIVLMTSTWRGSYVWPKWTRMMPLKEYEKWWRCKKEWNSIFHRTLGLHGLDSVWVWHVTCHMSHVPENTTCSWLIPRISCWFLVRMAWIIWRLHFFVNWRTGEKSFDSSYAFAWSKWQYNCYLSPTGKMGPRKIFGSSIFSS